MLGRSPSAWSMNHQVGCGVLGLSEKRIRIQMYRCEPVRVRMASSSSARVRVIVSTRSCGTCMRVTRPVLFSTHAPSSWARRPTRQSIPWQSSCG